MSIAATTNALAPELVVVGSLSMAGRVLFERLRGQASRYTMLIHRPYLKILPAKLKSRSMIYGAVALALDGKH